MDEAAGKIAGMDRAELEAACTTWLQSLRHAAEAAATDGQRQKKRASALRQLRDVFATLESDTRNGVLDSDTAPLRRLAAETYARDWTLPPMAIEKTASYSKFVSNASDDSLRVWLSCTPLGRWHRSPWIDWSSEDWAAHWANRDEALVMLQEMYYLSGESQTLEGGNPPESVRSNESFMLEACRITSGESVKYASAKLLEKQSFVLAVVLANADALQYLPAKKRADRHTVLAAVKQDGRALEHASRELQADIRIVLAALKQDGRALEHASPELLDDTKVLHAALQQNPSAVSSLLEKQTRALSSAEVLAALARERASEKSERERRAGVHQRTQDQLKLENQQLSAEIQQLKRERQHPRPVDVVDLSGDNGQAGSEQDAARGTKRNALVAAMDHRLVAVKKEKADTEAAVVGAKEDAEDQQEVAKSTALMLDRWQSYADELKKQVSERGGHPLAWEDVRARKQ